MSDGFILYRSVYDGVKDLDPATFKRLVVALMEYALDGKNPDLSGLENTIFQSWKANVDAGRMRRENGKKGGRPPKGQEKTQKTIGFETENHWLQSEKPLSVNNTETETETVTETDTVTDTETERDTETETETDTDIVSTPKPPSRGKTKKFVPPTVEEVRDYCQEKGYDIDAAYFVNWYEARGWMLGKTPMKSWKAAIQTWLRNQKNRTGVRSGTTGNAYIDAINNRMNVVKDWLS